MSNWVLKEWSRLWNMHSRVSGALCIGDYVCHGHNDQLPVQKALGSLHIVAMEIFPQLLSTWSKACMCLRSWEQLVVLLLQLHVRTGRLFDVIRQANSNIDKLAWWMVLGYMEGSFICLEAHNVMASFFFSTGLEWIACFRNRLPWW